MTELLILAGALGALAGAFFIVRGFLFRKGTPKVEPKPGTVPFSDTIKR